MSKYYNRKACMLLGKYTTGRAFLEALQEAGVTYIFSNFGSDHPAIIEALALSEKEGWELPEVIICPHEMVALSAAHAYAQIGRASCRENVLYSGCHTSIEVIMTK